MAAVIDFPKLVVIALAHAIRYLSAFGIEDALLETEFFTKFTTQAHMLLAANTLTNLEIYRNNTDDSIRGSLIWVLDQTKTKFGARLLRSWVGRPLVDKRREIKQSLRYTLTYGYLEFCRIVSMLFKKSLRAIRKGWSHFATF